MSKVIQSNMRRGDHLVSSRSLYTHHGIYLGDGKVVHYAGLANGFTAGKVEIATLADFTAGNSISVREQPKRKFNHEQAVQRALSRLNEDEYSVLENNCEHFVAWCLFGEQRSAQAETFKTALKIAGTVMKSSRSPAVVAFGEVVKKIGSTGMGPDAKGGRKIKFKVDAD